MSSVGPPFQTFHPREPGIPVVFDSPHSGFGLPADFGTAAPLAALRSTWDAYVDELFGDAPNYGALLLTANFPRAYIDVNRSADDIDPELLDAPWPGPLVHSDYARRGMGLIRRFALPGVPMYKRRLSLEEVRHRLNNYYIPYRTTLGALLDSQRRQFGRVIHINCHSMKSRGNEMNTDNGALRPDIVVSDRRGTTATPRMVDWIAAHFSQAGYRVQVNDPYQGGDLLTTFGRPAEGYSSLQIELNRALYMDERDFSRTSGFDPLQRNLARFMAALREKVVAEFTSSG